MTDRTRGSTAIPSDGHLWVDRTGTIVTAWRMRDAYRHSRPLSAARPTAHLNPGHVRVSTSAAAPTVVHGVRHDQLQPYPRQGRLQLLTGDRPVSADVDFDRLDAISVID